MTVTFNQPVYGVDAADLQINGQPAVAVSGGVGTNRSPSPSLTIFRRGRGGLG
ncbi:MAG: hypothetical protein QM813_24415 [Verrucomicrobiota bacterium]